MSQRFSTTIRQLVALRANFRCEYCRKPDMVANFKFHIEHTQTDIGEGTLRLLDFNSIERILERKELVDAGAYP